MEEPEISVEQEIKEKPKTSRKYFPVIGLTIIIIISLIIFSGTITGFFLGPMVEKGDGVTVEYTGKLDNGNVFDSSEGKAPLQFTAGSGQMIKGFDHAVLGMRLNEEKDIIISPEDGYGEHDAEKVKEYPKEMFEAPDSFQIGVTIVKGIEGETGRVVRVTNTSVFLDRNHPLAGQTLHFHIKIIGIEKLAS